MAKIKPRMGRKRLNRVKRNITLPAELASKLDELAFAEGRPLSAIIESLAAPYVAKHWTETMRLKASEHGKLGPKSGLRQ